MKVLVIGLSPYLTTSRSKVAALIMQHLYVNKIKVAGAVWGHDTNYFSPEMSEESSSGPTLHVYKFDIPNLGQHWIPIIPFVRGKNEAIDIYEIIKSMNPDVVITVGDYGDFLYMKDVKNYCEKQFKWLFVLTNYSFPIQEQGKDIINDTDGVLCTSEFSYNAIRDFYKKDNLKFCYIGGNRNSRLDSNNHKFRMMAIGKPTQVDNLPVIMEAASILYKEHQDIELYLHTSLYDHGDYNLEEIRSRFDPQNQFIVFPDKYVSLTEEVSYTELCQEISRSDIFISIPMVSATSMGVFDALSCGCFPILSNIGSNADLGRLLGIFLDDYKTEDFIIPCINLIAAGGSNLGICDPQALYKKMFWAYRNRKKIRGSRDRLSQFINNYERAGFLSSLHKMVDETIKSDDSLYLE